MKRVILMMVLILPLVFQSCKKDDDEILLAGTEWVYKYTLPLDNTQYETRMMFDEKTVMLHYYEDGVEMDTPEHGTYTLSGSGITIVVGKNTISGTINGDKMTLDIEGSSVVFVKK